MSRTLKLNLEIAVTTDGDKTHILMTESSMSKMVMCHDFDNSDLRRMVGGGNDDIQRRITDSIRLMADRVVAPHVGMFLGCEVDQPPKGENEGT